jgi:hypothetical protein
MAQLASETARKQSLLQVRLSRLEHAQISAEAARRGVTLSDLMRTLARIACGSVPTPDRRDDLSRAG